MEQINEKLSRANQLRYERDTCLELIRFITIHLKYEMKISGRNAAYCHLDSVNPDGTNREQIIENMHFGSYTLNLPDFLAQDLFKPILTPKTIKKLNAKISDIESELYRIFYP